MTFEKFPRTYDAYRAYVSAQNASNDSQNATKQAQWIALNQLCEEYIQQHKQLEAQLNELNEHFLLAAKPLTTETCLADCKRQYPRGGEDLARCMRDMGYPFPDPSENRSV